MSESKLLHSVIQFFPYYGVREADKVICGALYSLWLPLFIPHMAGTGLPPATMNRSLLHVLSTDSGPAIVN